MTGFDPIQLRRRRRVPPGIPRALVALGAVAGLAASGLAPGLSNPAFAAVPPDPVPREKPPPFRQTDETVLRIQKALNAIGLYLGAVDGRMNDATEAAIKVYQRMRGLHVDGIASEQLANTLDTGERVGELLERLDKARRENIDRARQALLAHPETRDLIEGKADEIADAARDSKPCFRKPTVRCLLHEAVESSKAIPMNDLRDWALGDILAAQARAGLGRQARETVRRIGDPRLIMVALRDIAEGQALGGRPTAALAAAEIIPDEAKKAEAYGAIADILSRTGDKAAAAKAVHEMLEYSDRSVDPVRRVAFRSRAAIYMARVGDGQESNENLAIAERVARDETPYATTGQALRHIAAAMAEMRMTEQAMAVLKDVRDDSDRAPVLVTAASQQADAGDAAAALATADSIEEVRFRAVVLGRIAVAQARKGDAKAAQGTIDVAMAAVDRIKMPYARSYAVSKIALALADIGGRDAATGADVEAFDRAVETAEQIGDAQLRAHTLWTVAARRKRAEDAKGAAATEAKAEAATDDIKSALNKVWMFADLAAQHVAADETKPAWQAFHRGLKVAEGVTNPWGRARVLARLSQTLVYLAANTPGAETAK